MNRVTMVSHQLSLMLVLVFMRASPLPALAAVDHLDLDNPVVTSQSEINQKLMACNELLDRLTQQARQGTLSPAQQRLKALAGLYVAFVGSHARGPGVEPGRLELVDLAQTRDPAVTVLRDQVKVPCPPGLVFVRYYPNRHVMPLEILPAFHRENTRGATILCRYIAIIEQTSTDPAQQRFLKQGRDRILSHELVHAYINAALGRDRSRLPVWFHEGCATHLSGSPGGQRVSELVETPAGFRHVFFQDKAPRDYQAYKLLFEYLQANLGRRELYAQIKQTIDTGSVGDLLASAQADDGNALLARAQAWKRRRDLTKYSVAVALVIGLLWLVWRMLPQTPKRTEAIV